LAIPAAHAEVRPVATLVCGALPPGTTTWSALASPYGICADGVTVPTGSSLVLDGTAGAVEVLGLGAGGLTVQGGVLSTLGTSDAATVSFDSASTTPAAGDWAGLVATPDQGTPAQVALSHISVAHAVHGLWLDRVASPATVDHAAVSDVSDTGILASSDVVSLLDSQVMRAGHYGVAVAGAAASPGDVDDVTVQRVSVTDSPGEAIVVAGELSVGSQGSVRDVTASGNGRDALGISGVLTTDTVWVSPGSSGGLGYYGNRALTLKAGHTLTLPKDAFVPLAGSLNLEGATLDATAGGAYVYSITQGPGVELRLSRSTGVPARAALVGATLDGLDVVDDSGATTAPGDSTHGLVFTNSAILGKIVVTDTPWQLTGGGVRDRISSVGTGVTLRDTLVLGKQANADGSAVGIRTGSGVVEVTNTAVLGAAGSGIRVVNSSPPGPEYRPLPVVIRGNHVEHAGADPWQDKYGAAFGVAPIALFGITGGIGPGRAIDANTGLDNFDDTIAVDGLITEGVVVPTATPLADGSTPLQLITSSLEVRGSAPLFLPSGAVLKLQVGGNAEAAGQGVRLFGPDLVVSNGAVITSIVDSTVGAVLCGRSNDDDLCDTADGMRAFTGGVHLHAAPSGGRRSAGQVNGDIRRSSLTIDSGATTAPDGSGYGLVLRNARLSTSQVLANATRVLVERSVLDQGQVLVPQSHGEEPTYRGGLLLQGSTGSLVRETWFREVQQTGFVHLIDASARLDRVRFDWSHESYAGSAFQRQRPHSALVVEGTGSASITCSSYAQTLAGLTLTAGSVVRDSNLLGGTNPDYPTSPTFDVDATAAPVDARANWWGQPAGAAADQTSHAAFTDTAQPRAVPSDCAPPLAGAPQSIRTHGQNRALRVEWAAPEWDGGSAITGYDLTVTPGGQQMRVSATARSATFTGLRNGLSVTVAVRAVNAAGMGVVGRGTARVHRVAHDYSGDGVADRATWRPSTGAWLVQGLATVTLGSSSDIPVPGDYNGDRREDRAVFAPASATWHVGQGAPFVWGSRGDQAVPADYNGDGRTDVAVWRPASGQWLIRGQSTRGLGVSGDVPAACDYNGDGTADIAVFRPRTGQWLIAGRAAVTLGKSGDVPLAADYNGDGRCDLAVYRPSTAAWIIAGRSPITFGVAGDKPVPEELTGSGHADIAVWRPGTGQWFVRGVVSTVVLGANRDRVV
jgi:hypothetical protein